MYYASMQKFSNEKLFWISFTVILAVAIVYVLGYILVRKFGQ
jgi:hypothetical protein